ncbi:MAG: hypothetical protein M3P95_03605 [Actinomycetota bacterium]|nr:hypothetical protein [Actinomycetota bacterium]
MAAPVSSTRPRVHRSALVLRVLAAAALGVSAYLHIVLAQGPLVSGGQVTLAGLFLAQAVVAGLVALWVLVRPGGLGWLAALAVGGASLAALVLSVYVRIPAVGPFPVLYEPQWYGDKVAAAVAAAVATVVAGVALLRRGAARGRKPV